MDTKEIEQLIGRKLVKGPSLKEQCTLEEYAEISYWTEVENQIFAERHQAAKDIDDDELTEKHALKHDIKLKALMKGKWNKEELGDEIEKKIREKAKGIAEKHKGDYRKALSELAP